MFDLCIISRYLPDEADDFNIQEDNWEDELEDTICGFKIVQNKEAMDEGEVVMIDAELRLPFDVTIGRRDRIILSYRLGEWILRADRETFRIVGQPVHGHSALVLKLVKDTEV
jgi:hypothetical protein